MDTTMNRKFIRLVSGTRAFRRVLTTTTAAAFALLVASPAVAAVAQTPLYLGGGNVPGNLLLVPSVEFPTVNSMANLGDYNVEQTYIGYFDPEKCYIYVEGDQAHFYPAGTTTGHVCNGQWSGNFMNWAATQTIDPFRKVLTGGYRVKDTLTETWLEKARHEGQGGETYYPTRYIDPAGYPTISDVVIKGATPLDTDQIKLEIIGLGNVLRIQTEAPGDGDDVYDATYDLQVRVAVCVPGLLEANCRKYSQGWKPEGLIQQYSDEMRIGIFGYLNDHNMLRDGGVLRAPLKFVGPKRIVPDTGEEDNPFMEWDPDTGVFIQNPGKAYADATASRYSISIDHSGVINYLNEFGQLTSNNHKNYDPVSELYYTAIRYLKGQNNVPEYVAIPGNTSVDAAMAADGFPVIVDWEDPIQYACQKNVILGIGDVYTHRDKNLPGSPYSGDEPPKPAAVASDNTVDVVAATEKVGAMEGITISTPFTGRSNSAFMAGLAWDAHTQDIRADADMPGTQTVSTHWVDVLEGQTLEPPAENQYYLAAKYGGFRVPEDFDPDTHTGPLNLEWWHSNGEMLSPFVREDIVGEPFPRPDNYYVAGAADQMIESLTMAFARISAELKSSASSVAANSTRLDSNTAVFQAAFDSSHWSGELEAYRIKSGGVINDTFEWSAADELDALTQAQIATRSILTITPPTLTAEGAYVSTTGHNFVWTELTTGQQDLLRQDPGGSSLLPVTAGQERLSWLRGSRLLEPPNGLLRERDSRLGDIVNSDPQFVHHQDFGYVLLALTEAYRGTEIGEKYQTFRESDAYKNRPPMIVVGANDGMLHGFDASLSTTGGTELFAYVPNAAYEHLYELTLPDYSHRFFVDASPRVADAWFDSAWHTIVVGATGAGGHSVFALDVTNPTSMTKSSVLWEFTHPDMGYTIGQPTVVPLSNGQFGVIVSSGYETGATDGTIWILDPADGSIIHEFSVPNSGDLGPPLAADLNSDRIADRIYVGDTNGNLWRFDIGPKKSDWGPPKDLVQGQNILPLFVATDASGTTRQAITAPLTSAFNKDGLHMVFFGTGSFYRVDDNVVPATPSVDSFYGIIDRGVPITRSELHAQAIIAEQTKSNGAEVRAVSNFPMAPGKAGWYLDLEWTAAYGGTGPAGERVVSKATVRGERIIFATLIPNEDPCAFGGESWIMELNTFSGASLGYTVFDVTHDGKFTEEDKTTLGGGDGETVVVSGVKTVNGIAKTPAVIGDVDFNPDDGAKGKDEIKVLAGSNGELQALKERGSLEIGRQSWRQVR